MPLPATTAFPCETTQTNLSNLSGTSALLQVIVPAPRTIRRNPLDRSVRHERHKERAASEQPVHVGVSPDRQTNCSPLASTSHRLVRSGLPEMVTTGIHGSKATFISPPNKLNSNYLIMLQYYHYPRLCSSLFLWLICEAMYKAPFTMIF